MESSHSDEVLPAVGAKATSYLDALAARVAAQPPAQIAARIDELVAAHDDWRARQCLNLNPAESLLSRRSRALLASDMATRLTEGIPGDKVYPHTQRQNDFIDEIEGTIIGLARQQFGARYVEWRPTSTSLADAAVFFALLRPGDVLFGQDMDAGGNLAYNKNGPATLAGAEIVSIPSRGTAFEFDLHRLATLVEQRRPRMIAIGGSNVLFPYPLRELRAIADTVGAVILYDAAHVGLLISSGDFQRPLEEGAHVVTISTHKIMGGPVGGMVLTNDAAIADKVIGLTFPGLMQTRDQNKYAALAVSLAETAAYGPVLAEQMVANAQALARALTAEGFTLVAADRGFTQTHQIFLELGDDAKQFEVRCNAANILLSDVALTGDRARGQRSGSRLATHEVTRQGMEEPQMVQIARLIRRATDGEDPATVGRDVETLLQPFQSLTYSFDQV
jgi:glycine hydroxymethyltransferase